MDLMFDELDTEHGGRDRALKKSDKYRHPLSSRHLCGWVADRLCFWRRKNALAISALTDWRTAQPYALMPLAFPPSAHREASHACTARGRIMTTASRDRTYDPKF